MKTVRVGAGQGFYGDCLRPAVDIARYDNVQYICFDCLAELTMAILQKDRQKDPSAGYTKDVIPVMKALLPLCVPKGTKLITNAGGINPMGAAKAVAKVARDLGFTGLKIGVVTGDDIHPVLGDLKARGINLQDYEAGVTLEQVQDKLMFASAYLGAAPIVEALRRGADVVITGRTTDTAQFLGPLIYEFGWDPMDYNRIAQGIVMGHIMECSGQATGGNFSGRWWEVPDLHRVGYPVSEISEDGSFIMTKPPGTGGIVTVDTVKEQFLYEIHDPAHYITPDVIADYTTVTLEQVGPDRVLVRGATGYPPPPTLKVVAGYPDGFVGEGRLTFPWPDAYAKAKAADQILRARFEDAGIKAEEILTEFVGVNSIHGPVAPEPDREPNEVMIRIAVRTKSAEMAARVGREFPPVMLAGPPSPSGLGGMIPVRELIALYAALIPREAVEPGVVVDILEV